MADCCKDILAAINTLNKKVDGLNNKVIQLEKNLSDLKASNTTIDVRQDKQIKDLTNRLNNGSSGNINLQPIYKRLVKNESDILDLGGIIKSVIDDVDFTNQSIKEHNETATDNQNIFNDIVLALLLEE